MRAWSMSDFSYFFDREKRDLGYMCVAKEAGSVFITI